MFGLCSISIPLENINKAKASDFMKSLGNQPKSHEY